MEEMALEQLCSQRSNGLTVARKFLSGGLTKLLGINRTVVTLLLVKSDVTKPLHNSSLYD